MGVNTGYSIDKIIEILNSEKPTLAQGKTLQQFLNSFKADNFTPEHGKVLHRFLIQFAESLPNDQRATLCRMAAAVDPEAETVWLLISEITNLILARNMNPSHLSIARTLAQVIATASAEERVYAEQFFDQLLGREPVDKAKSSAWHDAEEVPPEPKESEEELRAAMLARRFALHRVTDNCMVGLMRHYTPNLNVLPDGYITAGDPKTGKTYVLYFKLYSNEDLNPVAPWSRVDRPTGWEANGPNRGYQLIETGNSVEYHLTLVTNSITALMADDELDLLQVMQVRYNEKDETPLDLSRRDNVSFSLPCGVQVTLDRTMGITSEQLMVFLPNAKNESTRVTYDLRLELPFHDDADLAEVDLHRIAREIADKLRYEYPEYIGVAGVAIESCRFADNAVIKDGQRVRSKSVHVTL